MSRHGGIEDTLVGIQRDDWLAQIRAARQSHHEVTIWTHEETDTTMVVEQVGARIETGNCRRSTE